MTSRANQAATRDHLAAPDAEPSAAFAVRTYVGLKEARERGLLTGREARCSCGRTCPSDGTVPGFTDVPFLQYWGPGSEKAEEQCVCGYYRVAHGKPHIKCTEFRQREPDRFDSFYCGCRGWD